MSDYEENEKLRRIFKYFDVDVSGFLDTPELKNIMRKVGLSLDDENTAVLMRRYDEDGNGRLNEVEFCEFMLTITKLKKEFEAADTDKSGSISVSEMSTVAKSLNLKVAPSMVRSIMQLFDEDGSGTVDYQEFFALIFYFQELEYQYDNFKNKVIDYSWVAPLLGPENMDRVPAVVQQLQKMKASSSPRFDDFVSLIVQEAVAANIDPTGRRKRNNAPRITVVRNRLRTKAPPKKGIKLVKKKRPKQPKEADQIVTHGSHYLDASWPPGPNIVPQAVTKKIADWKRPVELNPAAQLFVHGVEEGDVMQGGLGDCWFLGALAVVATCTDDFIEHLFVEKNFEKGYYKCRFFKNGKWEIVTVDDRLPCGHTGRLFFAKCKDPTEFWVPIVEKAYAKLHGSYESLEFGNIADGLKDLTGEAVEVLMLDDKSYSMKADDLWKTLVFNFKESYLMGCAIENANAAAEHELPNGLLQNHAYSIIHCEDVKEARLMRIRNPWGRGEWNGPWADNTKEWTPQLLKQFNYTFENDGTFFMRFEDFLKNFNRIYVLRLMTDSKGEVWEKNQFEGEWKGETAGGCSNNPTWLKNPQYALTIKDPINKVFINLSQPDLRYVLKTHPGNYKRQYDPIGIAVLKTNETNYKKTTSSNSDRIATSIFSGMRDMSLEFTGRPGSYIIIPCTFNPNIELPYVITVYTEHPAPIAEVKAVMPKSGIAGAWHGRLAGGCVNHPATWMNNPQFILYCDTPGNFAVTLEQQLSPNQEVECVGIYIFKTNKQRRIERPGQLVVAPQTFENVLSVTENVRVEARQYYIIMPTTFDPVERKFQISVSSADARVGLFQALQ